MSLFNIAENLRRIFATVEENEGELTPELEQELVINKENFTETIKSYSNYITVLNGEIATVKAEQDRLNKLKKSKENTVERLKNAIATAIIEFGDTSKSGAKFIDFGTGKVSIRKTASVEANEEFAENIVNCLMEEMSSEKYTNQIDVNDVSFSDITDRYVFKSTEDSAKCENLVDLVGVNADITARINIKNLLESKDGLALLKQFVKFGTTSFKPNVDKKAIKEYIETNETRPDYANIVNKNNVIFK